MKIHAAHDAPAAKPGRCAYFWHWEDVTLWCSDPKLRGLAFCEEHRAPKYRLTDRQVAAFWSKVDRSGDCWLWTAAINRRRGGYGTFTAARWTYRTHVLAYYLTVGPVPDGLVLDHLCRTPNCVRPSHLEPVTNRENTIRGDAPQSARDRAAQKTHCKNGHPLSGDNLLILRPGHARQQRACKTCTRKSQAAHRARRRAERASSHFIEAAHYRADAGIPPATPTAVKAEAATRGNAT